ncbi:MAG: hypothetical protein EWV67_15180 [Microcystis sp. M_QC_C_20170808_M2Col]|nr:MAG: hypothetical protein EWV67_15180 [Microcystis sp. M_QC_C_20170808_M2Col]TRT71947.1 MAG: hypothetical protein EWV68_03360 [Microcystis sp. M_QC_C_20170808_M9Col]
MVVRVRSQEPVVRRLRDRRLFYLFFPLPHTPHPTPHFPTPHTPHPTPHTLPPRKTFSADPK